MDDRLPARPDAERLPEPVAARLLGRASELDQAYRTGVSIDELRAAAAEAGISERAFDAALTELNFEGQARVPDAAAHAPRRRRWALAAALATLIGAGGLALSQRLVPPIPDPAAPMVEEALLLRCLSPDEAAELIRPLLHLPTNTVVINPGRAPRVLTIRATMTQLQDVQAVLDEHEGAGSAACVAAPAPARVL